MQALRPVDRYLAHRRAYELAIICTLFVWLTLANTHTAWLDLQRVGKTEFAWNEVLIWEATSHAVWLVLLPVIGWWKRCFPISWADLRRHLPCHVLGALCVSVLHVLGMVALRKLSYWAMGSHYEYGDLPREFFYEALKDVRSYALVLVVWTAYDFVLLRWQGEASEIADAPKAPAVPAVSTVSDAPHTPSSPEPSTQRFLVRTLGKEFLIAAPDVVWVQAQGNYVNLHRAGRSYPLRATLSAMEQRLGAGFARCHRSYLVNLNAIESIEPTEFGDAVLHVRGGESVPCSRTFVDDVRARLLERAP